MTNLRWYGRIMIHGTLQAFFRRQTLRLIAYHRCKFYGGGGGVGGIGGSGSDSSGGVGGGGGSSSSVGDVDRGEF